MPWRLLPEPLNVWLSLPARIMLASNALESDQTRRSCRQSSDPSETTYIGPKVGVNVLLFLLASILGRRHLLRVHSGTLDADIVEGILVGHVDVLLLGHQRDFDVAANTLDLAQVGLDSVRTLGTPGQVVAGNVRFVSTTSKVN